MAEEAEEVKKSDRRLVAVKFGIDKPAIASYSLQYGGSAPNKRSTYYYQTELDVSKGDHIVVETPSHGLTVATVESVTELEMSDARRDTSKWIVSKVDDSEYRERIARQARKAELHRVLSRKAEEARQSRGFEELLAGDPEAEAMLKEFRSL